MNTKVAGAAGAVCLMLVTAVPPAAGAPSAAQKCASSKAKAAGSAVYARAKCEQKALAENAATDAACIAAADAKLADAYAKAEGRGGCDATGEAAAAQDAVDACVADFVAAIGGEAACAAAKMKASGKATASKAKCWQKSLRSSASADASCLATAGTKLGDAVASADALGSCTDTAAALETLVDACIEGAIADAAAPSCTLDDDTSPTGSSSPSGCSVLSRDTSSCEASRTAQGLSGYWLKFSCRVTLTRGASTVTVQSDGQPDYPSNYFPDADLCHEDYAGGIENPNEIVAQAYTVSFPLSPTTTTQTMAGPVAVVGISLNGVPVFGNFAAPGDNIFDEAATFDRCGAHPQQAGKYHYHSEPYSISYDDSSFVGMMRDGYPIYGRRDPDLSLPALDAQGGHTGVTVDSPGTPVYHYHVNEQVNPEDAGDSQWFLTTGTYHGTPGSVCTGCN